MALLRPRTTPAPAAAYDSLFTKVAPATTAPALVPKAAAAPAPVSRAGQNPTQIDFLGDGLAQPVRAPDDPNSLPHPPGRDGPNDPGNPGNVSNNEMARIQRAEQERLSRVPYGTPAEQGGTAQTWQVTRSSPNGPGGTGIAGPGTRQVTATPGQLTSPDQASFRPAQHGNTTTYDANGNAIQRYMGDSGITYAPSPDGGITPGQPIAAGTVTGTRRDSNGNVITIRQGTPDQALAYNDLLQHIDPAPGPPGSVGGVTQRLPFINELAPTTTGRLAGTPASDGVPATTGANPSAGGPHNPTTAANGGGGNAGAPNGGGGATPYIQQTFNDARDLTTIGRNQGADGAAPRLDMANQDVRAFMDEERARKGPSEAEALMYKSGDRAMAQSLGIAAGARGGAGARSRALDKATAANVALGSQTTQDVGLLRAKEDADRRGRLLEALGVQGNIAGTADNVGLGYTRAGADLYTSGVNAMGQQDVLRSNERLSAQDQAWREYMFGNLSAADKEAYRQAAMNRPTFGEQAIQTGLSLIPAVGQVSNIIRGK